MVTVPPAPAKTPPKVLPSTIKNAIITPNGISHFHDLLFSASSHQGAIIKTITRKNTSIDIKATPTDANRFANHRPIIPATGEKATIYNEIMNESSMSILVFGVSLPIANTLDFCKIAKNIANNSKNGR